MADEVDPVTLTLIIIYNAIIFGIIVKWAIPEFRKLREIYGGT